MFGYAVWLIWSEGRTDGRPGVATSRRVFFVDALSCPRCLTPMVVLALLSDPPVVKTILHYLGLPAEAPRLAPAMLAVSDGPLFEDGEGECDATGAPSRAPP
jgi:hypothetical protein